MTRSKKQKTVELQALHKTNSQIEESCHWKLQVPDVETPCTAALILGRSQTAVRARFRNELV